MKRRQFLQLSAAVTAMISTKVAGTDAARRDEPGPAGPSSRWQPRQGIRKPNIVIAVLDDIGFSDFGCYGVEHVTPAIDSIAATGVRFNNFHITALCAPTRACLLTGRNALAVGVGNIAEWGRDLPGYRGWIRKDAATLAEYLRTDAYSTLATGKWHLSAIHDQNGSGPYNHWPVGRGFDRWYGFHGNANELDDTILIVMSYNGAAGGGGAVEGILDVRRNAYYEKEKLAELNERFDALGSDDSYGMYASGWAQARNTPLKW